MTTSRFRLGILLLFISLLSGAFGWWLHPRYIDYQLAVGEGEAAKIAKACAIPDWALYFDQDGRRQTAGQGPGRPEYAGIYMNSNYGFCPPPERDSSIRCAAVETAKRGYKFFHEFRSGGCERNGTVE